MACADHFGCYYDRITGRHVVIYPATWQEQYAEAERANR